MSRTHYGGNTLPEITKEQHEGTLNAVRTYMVPKAMRIDTPNVTTKYIGEAPLGSIESDPVWRIQKIYTLGTVQFFTWADGNEEFDNIWEDRLTLDYV
jgi:hypothetical protein